MADVVTSMLQTTLLVLYFTAPAKTVHLDGTPAAKDAFEKTQTWTLQSTSQISTENPDMCVTNGVLLLQKFAAVSTVTVRLYCLCPQQQSANNNNVCDHAKQENARALSRFNKVAPPAAIIEIGPNTPLPNFSQEPQK
jgi:hypothetical protein